MHSSSMIRRFCCLQSATSPLSLSLSSKKKSLAVFLGSPQVSATVLDALFNASSASDSLFEINPEESWLSFDQEASVLHNKVRAFARWPGTQVKVLVEKIGEQKTMEHKIITTRVGHPQNCTAQRSR